LLMMRGRASSASKQLITSEDFRHRRMPLKNPGRVCTSVCNPRFFITASSSY
jgi:hypothetical protein